MTTKLEKFSLEAIKSAKEEVFEEIEVLLEGGCNYCRLYIKIMYNPIKFYVFYDY